MCAACEFLVSGTLRLFVCLFVIRALGSIERGAQNLIIIIINMIMTIIIIIPVSNTNKQLAETSGHNTVPSGRNQVKIVHVIRDLSVYVSLVYSRQKYFKQVRYLVLAS